MNTEHTVLEKNFDRAIEFLENRKIESLNDLTTDVEKKDLSNEFDKAIQVLKDRKKKLVNIQEMEKRKENKTKKLPSLV